MKRKFFTYRDHLRESLKDPAFRREWERTEPQYQAARALIKLRIEKGLTQRGLAKKAKTTQAVISRIESLSVNPSLGILEKIASVFGKKLVVECR